VKINFVLNGKSVELDSRPDARLLDILREKLGIKSVKEGCGEGECGACAVILDGKVVNSCLVPAVAVHGSRITTLEGILETPENMRIKRALEEAGAVQCGFCTPGIVLAIYTYLKNGGTADDTSIRKYLAGNLCRCTGYNMIIEAVKLAIEMG